MATIDKNFRIKHGLVVEGTTGTINGNNILTESAGDSYILNLVGGAALVKSVDNTVFTVDNSGKLTINAQVFDAYGDAYTAYQNANSYTDTAITNALTTFGSQTSTDIQNAVTTAENYTDTAISAEVTRANGAYDALGAASSAESAAKTYADGLISTEVSNRNSAIATAKTEAISAAESYADTAVANVVGLAPDALNTLQELAAAFNNQPDTLTNLITTVGGKQNALTAGDGIYIDGNDIITARQQSGGGLKFVGAEAAIDRSTVDNWYDASGAAASAQSNAESYADNAASNAQYAAQSYADGLASNYDAAGSAAQALSDAKSYTDSVILSDLSGYVTEQGTETLTNKTLIDPKISGNLKLLNGSGTYEAYISVSSDELLLDTDSLNIVLSPEGGSVYVDSSSTPNNIVATHGWVDGNFDAIGSASSAQSNANSYTDSAISNGNSNAEPTYKGVKIGNYTELVSGWNYTSNGSTFSPLTWNQNYGTAKLTVHVRSGIHTQASEILVAKDQSNNLAITEYAIVTTNGALADISVTANGSDISVTVTPTAGHDQTEAIASGSVIVWAD
jgi:hypothetical protein